MQVKSACDIYNLHKIINIMITFTTMIWLFCMYFHFDFAVLFLIDSVRVILYTIHCT